MVNITERGWAGHFICSSRCLFRRNTLIEVDNDSVVVSTVGCMQSIDGKGVEEIGVNRYYETMAFGTIKEGEYIEANVSDEREFNSEWCISADSWQEIPSDVDNIANDMHETVVAEFVEKMGANE